MGAVGGADMDSRNRWVRGEFLVSKLVLDSISKFLLALGERLGGTVDNGVQLDLPCGSSYLECLSDDFSSPVAGAYDRDSERDHC